MNLIPITFALATAFFWILGEVLGKLVLSELNATTFNMIGFSSAAIVLTPIVLFVGLGPTDALQVILAVTYGTFGLFAAFQIYFYTMKRSHAHIVACVGNSAPVWTLLFAPLLIGEKITMLLVLSLGLVVIGSIFFIQPKKERSKWKWAVPLSLAVAALWGCNMVIQKSAINSGMSLLGFLWISVVSAAVLFSLTGIVTRSWRSSRFTMRNLRICVVSIISSRFVGAIFYLSALGMENVSALAPFISATIPFAFVLSVLIVREKPTKRALIGTILIFIGLIVAAI